MLKIELILHVITQDTVSDDKQYYIINCLFLMFALGNGCPYISDDLNEDTISVLVRLITEKKGRLSER